jgi:hypothetical protein
MGSTGLLVEKKVEKIKLQREQVRSSTLLNLGI